MMTGAWWKAPPKAIDQGMREAAFARQGQLTKPPGSLGRLETAAVDLAGMQGCVTPGIERPWIVIFAADHGVVAAGVSAFPQSVTGEMIRNFSRGGAAICVLARESGAQLEVVDVGSVESPGELPGVRDARIAAGTADLSQTAAMTAEQCQQALAQGRAAAARALDAGADLFIGGEMGIGNTTAAAALICAYTGLAPALVCGPGTGLDAAGVSRKAAVVAQALKRQGAATGPAVLTLAQLGGFEIAALCGAYIACAQAGLPVVVDGFIASAAALAAERMAPGTRAWMLFGHASAEPGHAAALSALQAQPLLDLGLRLGEGSGAAAALPLLRLACALHRDMATFAEAGVSQG
nr:nicotinate-nucleotide--dimethylbenzimidazole phosphoribosyltransferase [Magnetofaba australis]